MILNSLMLALREIYRNLMRSFLTMLGIVIGIASVITMVTLGNGATQSVSQQISSLGSNLIMIMPGRRMGMGATSTAPMFKIADADAIRTQISNIRAVAPVASYSATVVAGAKNWQSSVTGSNNEYFITGNWKLSQGREFSNAEIHSGKAVCIIGDRVKRELFDRGNPIGSDLRISKLNCQIIGLLTAKGQGSMGNDQDDFIAAPILMVQRRLIGNNNVNSIMVSAKDGVSTDILKTKLEILLREIRKIGPNQDDDFNVLDTKQISETLSGTTKVMTLLLGAVAAVSLIVGGIGIMNIMLVSVTERTREIGIRLAIGALESEVLLQFLMESIVLSLFGGIIGIVLATLASIGLSSLMMLPYSFDAQITLVAFIISAVIGVVFGYMPAKHAAMLNPIDALRHE